MTWIIRERPHNVGGDIVAEYECATHGRFVVTAPRDANGDPPAVWPCPDEDCGLHAPYRISAVAGRVKLCEVVRGKSDARPPDWHTMDTSVLADGMPMDEFKRRRAVVHRDESLRRVRTAFGRTPKVWSR